MSEAGARAAAFMAQGGICGWVNAKNSYGGYSGFAVFFVNSEGKVAILTPELSEPSLC